MSQIPTRSTARPHRLAAIDIGTNSVRLIVAETGGGGGFRIIDDEKVMTRLGRGWSRRTGLTREAMESSALAVARLKAIADGYQVDELRVVATCAVREARNGQDFVDLVGEIADLEVEILSGEEEAKLAFLSVSRAFNLQELTAAVVDIGGGSTEIVLSSGGMIEQVVTVPLGAVRLTEKFRIADRVTPEQYYRLRRKIRTILKGRIGTPVILPRLVIGTGGTFTTAAAVSIQRASVGSDAFLPFTVRGYEMQRSEVKHILEKLAMLSARQRSRVPGLSPDRADIIVAGLAIVDGVLKHFATNLLRVHDQGIRAGLLLTMIDKLQPEGSSFTATPLSRMDMARQFAAACHSDRPHGDHVAWLALRLYDQLVQELGPEDRMGWCAPESRELLEAAALLHEVGYYIKYAKHHKHTYHLIIHSDLQGFTHRELEIIANVARYHRRAVPKCKHPNFARLNKEDQELVRRLAAILRLANGLDRGHSRLVNDVILVCREGLAEMLVRADSEPLVDLWGAERKGRLFEKVFGYRLRFSWSAPPPMDITEPKLARRPAQVTGPAQTL